MTRIIEADPTVWNNFHTHTYRCRHAEGDIADYVKKAAELGMNKIGFSEHAFIAGMENPLCMPEEDIPGYVEACRAADGEQGISVLCGMECDYDPSDESFFREFYLGQFGMDYLVGSVHVLKGRHDIMNVFANSHFGVKELRIYTDLYVRMIESRLFTFCAHPDLFGRPIEVGEGSNGWDENAEAAAKEILDAAEENGTVLEINTSGIWKTRERGHKTIIYPRWQFWEMASDRNIRVIANTDSHSVEKLDSGIDYGMELIRRYNLRRVELEKDQARD